MAKRDTRVSGDNGDGYRLTIWLPPPLYRRILRRAIRDHLGKGQTGRVSMGAVIRAVLDETLP